MRICFAFFPGCIGESLKKRGRLNDKAKVDNVPNGDNSRVQSVARMIDYQAISISSFKTGEGLRGDVVCDS